MDGRKKEKLINRIVNGIAQYREGDDLYLIKSPTSKILCEADEVYDKTINEFFYGDMYLSKDLDSILKHRGIWNEDNQKVLSNFEKQIEDLKVKIYLERFNREQVKKITQQIETLSKSISHLLERKHSLDHITLDGYANMVRRQYVLMKTITKGKQLVFNKTDDFKLLERIFNFIYKENISIEEIRELARSDPWRSYWEISKPRPFTRHFSLWSDEQRTLVKYSKMYDNIFAHPECPSDDVIENNYMLDGWIIIQNREREKDRKKKGADDLVGERISQHTEQFISPTTLGTGNEIDLEYVKNIKELNDLNAKRIQQQREKVINKHGKVEEVDLPDVKQDLMNEIRRTK